MAGVPAPGTVSESLGQMPSGLWVGARIETTIVVRSFYEALTCDDVRSRTIVIPIRALAVHSFARKGGVIPPSVKSVVQSCGHHGGCSEIVGADSLLTLGATPREVMTVGIFGKGVPRRLHGLHMVPCVRGHGVRDRASKTWDRGKAGGH